MCTLNLEIIKTEDETEIRKIFTDKLVNQKLCIQGYDLKIFPEDFEHICYQDGKGADYKATFSLRRARKMLAIKALCDEEIPYVLIFQKERENQSVIVLAEAIEFAMYIIPTKAEGGYYFKIGTIRR